MTGPSLDDATVVSRREDVIAERVLDETVILDPQSDRYVRLNTSARSLWEALAQPRTLQALADGLVAEFGIEQPRARADAATFVGDLVERELVQIAG